jgi:predicted small secreted protein
MGKRRDRESIMRYPGCRQILVVLAFLAMAGCATFPGAGRVVKSYPHPARETVVAVNQALRDLNFFPTDLVPSHSNPRLAYVSTAYREQSLGEIVYVAVRDMGAEQSQVEVLTRSDLSGVWTWSTWWPPLIFQQTDRRLRATPRPHSAPMPPPPPPDRLSL